MLQFDCERHTIRSHTNYREVMTLPCKSCVSCLDYRGKDYNHNTAVAFAVVLHVSRVASRSWSVEIKWHKSESVGNIQVSWRVRSLTISWQTLWPAQEPSIAPGLAPKPAVPAHTVSFDDNQTKSVELKNQRVGLSYHWKSASSPTPKQWNEVLGLMAGYELISSSG